MRFSYGHVLFFFYLALGNGACSTRAAPQDVHPIWPDLILDVGQDRGAAQDLGRDQPPAHRDQRHDHPLDLIHDQDSATEAAAPNSWQSIYPGSVDLHAIACVQGHVYAVGDQGTILHHAPSTQPNPVFTLQSASTSVDLFAVSFADLSYGVIGGKNAVIWSTSDGGSSWVIPSQCGALTFDTFYSVHLASATSGFGAGIVINDQGAAFKYYENGWICGPTTYPGEIFYDVFRQGSRGWIVGQTNGKIYHTEDIYNWTSLAAGTPSTLRGVYITESHVGVAVGDKGTIVRSTDGVGKVWIPVAGIPTAEDLWAVSFWDNTHGWAVGRSGTILATQDGGQSWVTQPSNTAAHLEGICFTSASEGWIVGQGGLILYTTTGGAS